MSRPEIVGAASTEIDCIVCGAGRIEVVWTVDRYGDSVSYTAREAPCHECRGMERLTWNLKNLPSRYRTVKTS